jgi:hypothetical protein
MEMGMDTIHVSNMSHCANVGYLNRGDTLAVQAFYNTTMYAPMMGPNNTLEPVMGIAIVYVISNGSSTTSSVSTSGSSRSTRGVPFIERAAIAAAIAAPLIPLAFAF